MEPPTTTGASDKPGRDRRVLITGGSGFIGTHLLAELGRRERTRVVNYDRSRPERSEATWWEGDVRDADSILAAVRELDPTDVVHLAARTDVGGDSVSDYDANTVGTIALLQAVSSSATVRRVIVASTQFVCRPGHVPTADDDYAPHTAYGWSKVEAERATRSARMAARWTIVRPTTIWGPGDLAYRAQFYRVLQRGWYLHPAKRPARRSLTYVGNAVHQLLRILDCDDAIAHGRTLYVGDPEIYVLHFVEAFARGFGRPAVRTVPPAVVRGLALMGDAARRAGLRFPIHSERYRSMVEDYPVPLGPTFELVGRGPYSLEEGVAATVDWLRARGRAA